MAAVSGHPLGGRRTPHAAGAEKALGGATAACASTCATGLGAASRPAAPSSSELTRATACAPSSVSQKVSGWSAFDRTKCSSCSAVCPSPSTACDLSSMYLRAQRRVGRTPRGWRRSARTSGCWRPRPPQPRPVAAHLHAHDLIAAVEGGRGGAARRGQAPHREVVASPLAPSRARNSLVDGGRADAPRTGGALNGGVPRGSSGAVQRGGWLHKRSPPRTGRTKVMPLLKV